MFGGNMMQKLQEMKQKMEESKERLETIQVSETSPDGNVQAVATAGKTIKEIKINDDFRKSADKEELEEMVLLAVARVMQKAGEVAESEAQGMANDLMPGLGGLG